MDAVGGDCEWCLWAAGVCSGNLLLLRSCLYLAKMARGKEVRVDGDLKHQHYHDEGCWILLSSVMGGGWRFLIVPRKGRFRGVFGHLVPGKRKVLVVVELD